MYQCINELWLYNYSFIQLPLLQSFFQNIALKGYLTQRWIGYRSLFNFTEKTFLQSVDHKQPKNVKFDLSFKLSQGEVHDFSGEVQKFAGEVQKNLIGGEHLPTPPLKIRPWDNVGLRTIVI
jgi:hypothetical protein